MSSPFSTGRKSEMLWALPIVIELAEDTLTQFEFDETERISRMLAGSKGRRREAIHYLMKLVSPPPKRPLYYAEMEMQALPRWTRDAIRYLGDYVDLLVKAMAFEYTKNCRCKKYSLGRNLGMLKPRKHGISSELIDKLKRYNSFLYRPGKHDFRVPRGQGHRFTSKEVVLTAFITMKLAGEIKKISQFAEKVSLNEVAIQDL